MSKRANLHPGNVMLLEDHLCGAKRDLTSAFRVAEWAGLGGMATRLLKLAERVEREQDRLAAMVAEAEREKPQ